MDKYNLVPFNGVPGTVSCLSLVGLVSEKVGGIFGYVTPEIAEKLLPILDLSTGGNNHTYWILHNLDENNDVDFRHRVEGKELLSLTCNDKRVGYMLAGNSEVRYLMTAIQVAALFQKEDKA